MKTHVHYVSHWTITTKSDHKALFVLLRLRRGNKTRDLLICSANMGGHFDEADLKRILEHKPHVLALQEGGDQQWVVQMCKHAQYTYLHGNGAVGQASTPTFVSNKVKVEDNTLVKIIGSIPIGPGAGPDTSKVKWWAKNKLSLDGIRFGASSIHLTASQQNKKRFWAALKEMMVMLPVVLHIRRPMFLIGDFNSDLLGKLMKLILGRGLTSNHEQLGKIPTHENNSYDAVLVQRRLVA